MGLVLDTSVLVGAFDTRDKGHVHCAQLVGDTKEELIVPTPVLVELEYLLRRGGHAAAWDTFVEEVEGGVYGLYHVSTELLARAARLQRTYHDMRIGFVDAVVFVTCVELGERKVATLDRRHFSVLRTDDGDALEIVPA